MDLGTVTHLRQWVEALQATLGSSSGISLDLREPGRKLLDNLPGGPLAFELSCLKNWAEGDVVPTDQLRTAVDQFLRQEPSSLHNTLHQPHPSTLRLFYTSPKVAFDVEHQAHPLSVGRRIIDPLLDFPPYHEVFSALEAFTEGGPRLHFYSLGLYACAQPGMAPLTPSIVFDLLENPHCRCLMIEKVLYLVDTKTIPHAVLQPLDEALRQGYVIEVKPILVTPGALPKISKPDSAAIQSRFAPSPSSQVPQAQIQHKVEARWLYGDNIPTTDAFQDIPSLKAWLDAHHKLLHETDMRKIRKCIEAIWRRCCDEATYEEQIDNLKDQLLGILGEVSHRPSILNEYHEARQLYPDSLLFVEGEISISNRKASDALIGIFTPAGELVITHLFEVSVDYRSEEPLHVQQRATMLDRLPNEGLTLHVSETESYDVSPQAEATLGYVFLSTRSQHQEFQILTQKIVGEIMSLLTLRRHTAGLLSLKTRRNIRAGRKMIAESRLAKTLIDDLWEEFAQKRKQEDFYDLPWLLMQLRALLPFVNEGVSEIILGYAACLENMSPDLSFKRKKIADVKRGLPPHVTIVPETLRRYECAIEAHFKQHGLMIHFDPLKAANLVKGTGRERRKAMGECWVKSSPQGVYQEIMRRAALEAKLEARRHFEGYAAVLKNLSADLNDAPEKTRRPDQSVASFTGVSESQIARYVIEIETLLEGKKWAITLDPLATKKNNLRQGHALSSKISRIWEQPSPQEVAVALLRIVAEEKNNELKKDLEGYLYILKSFSEINTAGKRMTDGDIVVATELTPGKIARYSKEIEKRLRAKNWRVLEDPSQGLVRIRKAAGAISKKFEEAFNKGSPSEAVIYLTSEEKRYEPNSEERRLLSLYKTCFENVVRIPGVAKPRRRSFEFIRQKTGSLYGTIRKYQIDVENRAKLLGWEVLPKPSVEKGASTDARFEFSSIILWAKENNESFETIQAELQSTIDELENENEKKALKRYVTLFNLINEDPRDIKLLFSIREWEDKIGTDYRTVYKSVKFIRECLRGL